MVYNLDYRYGYVQIKNQIKIMQGDIFPKQKAGKNNYKVTNIFDAECKL